MWSQGGLLPGEWDARSPQQARRGSTPIAGAPLPKLPDCTPRLRRTCAVYGVSPRVRLGAAKKKAGGKGGATRAREVELHQMAPLPPMPLTEDSY